VSISFIPTATVESAPLLGFDSITMLIDQWGNAGTGNDPTSLATPDFGVSLSGIAIAASSMIDRCNLGVASPGNPTSIAVTKISRDQPFLGQIYAPWHIAAASESLFANTFLPQASAVAQTFGGALPAPQWTVPRLDVILYFRPPFAVSTKRAAFFEAAVTLGTVYTPGATETLARAWAAPGRSRIRITARIAGAGTVSCRVTGILGPSLLAPFASGLYEVELAPAVVATAPNSITFLLNTPSAYFVCLKATATAGAPTIPSATIEAED
jgi:hypothetical protein